MKTNLRNFFNWSVSAIRGPYLDDQENPQFVMLDIKYHYHHKQTRMKIINYAQLKMLGDVKQTDAWQAIERIKARKVKKIEKNCGK